MAGQSQGQLAESLVKQPKFPGFWMELLADLGNYILKEAVYVQLFNKCIQSQSDGFSLALCPFFSPLALGNVHGRTNELHQFIHLVQDSVAHAVKVSDGPIR